MGIRIDVEIEIGATPERVFELLTRREEVARWAGVEPDYLPSDGSQLFAGYRAKGQMQAPGGAREFEFEVISYDAPTLYAYRETYAGGDQTSTYGLTPSPSGTHLKLSSDTDYARMAMPQQAQAQIASLPDSTRALVQQQLEATERQLESGAFDENPAVRGAMEAASRTALERLKGLAET